MFQIELPFLAARPAIGGAAQSSMENIRYLQKEPKAHAIAYALVGQTLRHYFFLLESRVGCHPPIFRLGAAAMMLIFSFFGFLASRLPLCSLFATPNTP
jgi:hypothetical protein